MRQLFIKLEDDQRGWAWTHLEDVIELLEQVRTDDNFDKYPLVNADLEFLEHLTAIFKEDKCVSCGEDFSK